MPKRWETKHRRVYIPTSQDLVTHESGKPLVGKEEELIDKILAEQSDDWKLVSVVPVIASTYIRELATTVAFDFYWEREKTTANIAGTFKEKEEVSQVEQITDEEINNPICPRCGSGNVEVEYSSQNDHHQPDYGTEYYKYTCKSCGHKWEGQR